MLLCGGSGVKALADIREWAELFVLLPRGSKAQFQPFKNKITAATVSYRPNKTIGDGISSMEGCMLPVVTGGATAVEIAMV